MRALSASIVFARLAFAVIALAALLSACADAPEALEPASDRVADAPEAEAPIPMDATDALPEAPEPAAEDGQAPSDAPVTPAPRPRAPEVISAPLPERPPMRAPEPPARQEKPATRNTAAADAFWQTFQRAVRSRDRAAIARGLADRVRVGDETFAKSSEQVQAVLQAIVEEDAAREAYLAVDGLTHGPRGSTFETTAHYTVEGEDYEVVVFGRVEEVAPGDWRLAEVGSR